MLRFLIVYQTVCSPSKKSWIKCYFCNWLNPISFKQSREYVYTVIKLSKVKTMVLNSSAEIEKASPVDFRSLITLYLWVYFICIDASSFYIHCNSILVLFKANFVMIMSSSSLLWILSRTSTSSFTPLFSRPLHLATPRFQLQICAL